VEDLLVERGLDISYESIRYWVLKFGKQYARRIDHRRPRPGSRWHLYEVFVTINGIAWQDGGIVFKPNYMPKKYAITIVPISGFLVSIAALASIFEDSSRLKTGTFQQAKDMDIEAEIDQS